LGQEPHPKLLGEGASSKRRLDFVAKIKGKKDWAFVIETKSLPLTTQGLVNDLFRLALLGKSGTRRYFLVAGELSNVDWKYLRSERRKARGEITNALRVPFRLLINVGRSPRRDLLRLFLRGDYEQKTVDLKKAAKYAKKYVVAFQTQYNRKEIPRRYVTKLKSWSRKNRFVAVVWEINVAGWERISFLPDVT
jgi:hypothetical protein